MPQLFFNRDVSADLGESRREAAVPRPVWLIGWGAALAFSIILWSSNDEPVAATHAIALPGMPAGQEPTVADKLVAEPLALPAHERLAASKDPAGNKAAALADAVEQAIELAPPPAAGKQDKEAAGVWQEVTVKRGDSLALIFDRLGLTQQQLHTLLEQGGAASNLKKIYPGQTFRVMSSADNGLEKLTYRIDNLSTLEVTRNGDGFDVSTSHRTPEFRTNHASGIITSNLFLAAGKAGMSDNITMELAGIFGWDIDFALDIREGDAFTVLYEEMYLDGESIGNGEIIAAEFINQGKTYQAFRYTDKSGKTDYYSLDGKSMRKTFLRTPVELARISSRFNLKRKHPILNKIRAHKGVDYAAARGTPVKATGNGKIVHRGKKGGYGNTIVIQHGSEYSTLYAHLSKYRGGLKVGSRVSQGQVIGYIGSSGLATGPHLHYEFRVNGVHRDPLRVKLPGAEPLDGKYMSDFKSQAQALIAQLDVVRTVQVASNN